MDRRPSTVNCARSSLRAFSRDCSQNTTSSLVILRNRYDSCFFMLRRDTLAPQSVTGIAPQRAADRSARRAIETPVEMRPGRAARHAHRADGLAAPHCSPSFTSMRGGCMKALFSPAP